MPALADTVGGYALIKPLGRGELGETFLARKGAAAPVVLKVLRPEVATSPELLSEMLAAARAAMQLEAPGLIACLGLGDDQGRRYLLAEYVPGRSLGELIQILEQRRGRFDLGFTLFVGLELVRSLNYAHQYTDASGRPAPILHGSIDPDRVRLSTSGAVRLGGFERGRGWARLAASRSKGLLAPEAAAGLAMGPRSDVFGLGALLYTLITGRAPTIEKQRLVPPSRIDPHVPPALDMVLMGALQTQPQDRWASIAAFGDALTGVAREQSVRAAGFAPRAIEILRGLAPECFQADGAATSGEDRQFTFSGPREVSAPSGGFALADFPAPTRPPPPNRNEARPPSGEVPRPSDPRRSSFSQGSDATAVDPVDPRALSEAIGRTFGPRSLSSPAAVIMEPGAGRSFGATRDSTSLDPIDSSALAASLGRSAGPGANVGGPEVWNATPAPKPTAPKNNFALSDSSGGFQAVNGKPLGGNFKEESSTSLDPVDPAELRASLARPAIIASLPPGEEFEDQSEHAESTTVGVVEGLDDLLRASLDEPVIEDEPRKPGQGSFLRSEGNVQESTSVGVVEDGASLESLRPISIPRPNSPEAPRPAARPPTERPKVPEPQASRVGPAARAGARGRSDDDLGKLAADTSRSLEGWRTAQTPGPTTGGLQPGVIQPMPQRSTSGAIAARAPANAAPQQRAQAVQVAPRIAPKKGKTVVVIALLLVAILCGGLGVALLTNTL